MSKKIYLIMGVTGEYSDRNEWPVCFKETKEEAETLLATLNEQAKEYMRIQKETGVYLMTNRDSELKRYAATMLDKSFSCDYTGTDYQLWVVSDDPSESIP